MKFDPELFAVRTLLFTVVLGVVLGLFSLARLVLFPSEPKPVDPNDLGWAVRRFDMEFGTVCYLSNASGYPRAISCVKVVSP